MDELIDDQITKVYKPTYFKLKLLLYWIVAIILSYFFKVLHWPGASLLFVLSTAGITAYTLSAFIRLRGKDTQNNVVAIICVIWLVLLIYGAFFNQGVPFNSRGLNFYLICLATCFGIQELIKFIRALVRKNRG